MKTKLLKGGEVVSGGAVILADVLVGDGKILKIGKGFEGDETIDCRGKVILPGMIDAHVHFRDFKQAYKEDFESGSKAAVSGGVTTVLDMPNNDPLVLTCEDLARKRKHVAGKSYCNYGFYLGVDGKNTDEINKAEGIPGVKVYAAHSTGDMGVEDNVLENIFKNVNKFLIFHAEDNAIIEENKKKYLAEFAGRDVDPAVHSKIRSVEAAVKAVERICKLAVKYKRRVHIAHVSTEKEVEILSEYREFVTCEVAPHHLMFCSADYEYLGNLIKMNPPVREREDIFAMWQGLKFGQIDIVATDHAPHTLEEKSGEYLSVPSGVPGVETVLAILLNAVNDEALTLVEVAKFVAERPAEIFGISGKGRVEIGYDADLAIVDMDLEKKIERKNVVSKCGWSPYEGLRLKGWPVMTFVGGEVVFENGKVVGKGVGKEVKFC